MINQQLIDYINQSRQAGKKDEEIRQSLILEGWPQNDIDQAINFSKEQNFSFHKKDRKNLFKMFFLILGLVFVVVLVAFIILNGFKKNNQSQLSENNQEAINQTDQKNIVQKQTISDSDIGRVKTILDEIKQFFLIGNNIDSFKKHLSIESEKAFSDDPTIFGSKHKSFVVNYYIVYPEEENVIIANVTITMANDFEDTLDMVFIRENNDWKFDLERTMDRLLGNFIL